MSDNDDFPPSSDSSDLSSYDGGIADNREINAEITDIPCYNRLLNPLDEDRATAGDIYMQYQFGIPHIPTSRNVNAESAVSGCTIHTNTKFTVSWPGQATFTIRPQVFKLDPQDTLYHSLGVTGSANPGNAGLIKRVIEDVMKDLLPGDPDIVTSWAPFGKISTQCDLVTIQSALSATEAIARVVADKIEEGLKCYAGHDFSMGRSEALVLPDVEVPSGGFVLENERGWGVWANDNGIAGAVLPVVVLSEGKGDRKGLMDANWAGQLLTSPLTSTDDISRMQGQIDTAKQAMSERVVELAQNVLAQRGMDNIPYDLGTSSSPATVSSADWDKESTSRQLQGLSIGLSKSTTVLPGIFTNATWAASVDDPDLAFSDVDLHSAPMVKAGSSSFEELKRIM